MPVVTKAAKHREIDLDALRKTDMRSFLQHRSRRICFADLYFIDVDKDYTATRTPAREKALSDAVLERAFRTLRDDERPVLYLASIDLWCENSESSIADFFLSYLSVQFDEVIRTLYDLNLNEHAALFLEGRALIGSYYGTLSQRYHRFHRSGRIADSEEMKRLSERYNRLPRLTDIAIEHISKRPELSAYFEALKASIPDHVRIDFLAHSILEEIEKSDSFEEKAIVLSSLPQPYSDLVIVFDFARSVSHSAMNGYFSSSQGNSAPELPDALERMKLKAQAEAVRKALQAFPTPFLRDAAERSAVMKSRGETLGRILFELTGEIDLELTREAMLSFVQAADIMPV